MSDVIIRIAARGDGVTESGKHVAMAVPGDRLAEDGTVSPGPHHQQPPCRHFPECGGCQLQHADDVAYADYLRSRIVNALSQHGLSTEVRKPHLSPPNTRRRAALRAIRAGRQVSIGFNAERSNRIVDMRECHVLAPPLFALVAPLRRLLADFITPRRICDVQMTLADQGVDLLLKEIDPDTLQQMEALAGFAETHRLARLSIDRGLGPETLYAPVPATTTLDGRPVPLPHGAFLQATADGEAALVSAVQEVTAGAGRTADLFAGLGTFALALSGRVYAAEAGRDAAGALRTAAPDILVEHRDLYRRPLDGTELAAFDAVVLDPPRAGAAEQIAKLAVSQVPKVAYVSCNPATFARDAKEMVDAGYALDWVQPVGQFRWSTHVELAACFSRSEA